MTGSDIADSMHRKRTRTPGPADTAGTARTPAGSRDRSLNRRFSSNLAFRDVPVSLGDSSADSSSARMARRSGNWTEQFVAQPEHGKFLGFCFDFNSDVTLSPTVWKI